MQECKGRRNRIRAQTSSCYTGSTSNTWRDRDQDARISRVAKVAAESVAEMGSAAGDGIGVNHSLIQNLFALDRAQSTELGHLRATVTVLVDMLLDAGALDETAFNYRLEAEIDRFDSEEKAAATIARKVECYNCRQQFEPERTQVDGTGTICDRCLHTSG